MPPPLSEQMRPKAFEEVVGQEALVGKNGFIQKAVERNTPLSILLWGPPGSGKTSIARLYAKAFSLPFETISAIFSGVADLKKLLKDALSPLLLFVDEIHRFNKAQQDAFLPFLESGQLILIGATVENPSFYLNNALLSRMRVLKLEPLNEEHLGQLLEKYEASKGPLPLNDASRKHLVHLAQGDGRFIYNLIENLEGLPPAPLLGPDDLEPLLQKKSPYFDKGGDQHYNLISALHKSVRGSDPDASLYWLARILHGGEDPLFVARRVVRMASEDIGLADPQALPLALAAYQTYHLLGSPEGELALAEAVVYLALAPKSNAIYTGYGKAQQTAEKTGHLDPPSTILNAPTKLMKGLGFGKGYRYDHDTPHAFSGQNYFPDALERQEFYHPKERGFERELIKRIHYFNTLRDRFHASSVDSA